MESNYQNQLLQSRLEVQEQSFKYFSEEIHDNVGQLLSLVKLQLHHIKENCAEPAMKASADNSAEILGKAISDLRSISHTMSSTFVAGAGLAGAIRKDLDYITSAKSIVCRLNTTGEEYSLGEERELMVFRVVQEAVANAIKHAMPKFIEVRLQYLPDAVNVEIADNGKGFDVAHIDSDGIGMHNMKTRIGLLKGKMDITSSGKGTNIHLHINREQTTATV